MTKMTVIGCGYLGAVHAACMAQLGHDVVGIDVDSAKVELLSSGQTPFFEPGFADVLQDSISTGRLSFTSDISAAQGRSVHFVCVGTPQKRNEYAADMAYVDAAVTALVPHLSAGDLVVGKSTVPVGTARRLADLVTAAEPGALLAWNPEFLREGFAVEDTLHPDRLVYGLPSGADGVTAKSMLDEVYATPLASGVPLVVTDYSTAELVKAAANSFLATKISFINAMAEVCEASGADVVQLADAIGYDAPHRPAVPERRTGLRRRLPAEGHPRVHGPRRRTRGRPGAGVPAGDRLHQHAPPGPDGRPRPRGVRRIDRGPPDRRPRSGVQAEQRRHQGLPRPERRRADAAAGCVRGGHRPGGCRERAPQVARPALRRDSRKRPRKAPIWSCC